MFPTKREAEVWLREHLDGHGRAVHTPSDLTFGEFAERYLTVHAAGREASTIATLRERLRRPLATFGETPLRELEARTLEIGEWAAGLPPGYRHAVVGALRQTFDAACRWNLIASNPAKAIGPNPEPRRPEVVPLSIEEIDRIAVELGPWGPLVIFASETGLRPSEWIALEWRDVSYADSLVRVERTFAKSVLKDYGKTARSRRRVPVTRRAADALRTMPRTLDAQLLFPNGAGRHLDLNNWRRREWTPALDAAGVAHRSPYALRHTFAAAALDAGISIYEVSRYMGCGVRIVDRTYGHLVPGSEDRARAKLDERAERELWAEGGRDSSDAL